MKPNQGGIIVSKNKVEIIKKEKIYEPTGKYQPSGREVIYTKKTVMKIGKYTVTVIANEPSEEAIREFNKCFIKNVMLNEYDTSIE